ncbi:hypothetical protein D3C85_1103050 [compost metagenome]
MVGLVVAILVALLSGVIIDIFFNDTYNASIEILRYLSLAILIKYISSSAAAFMMTNEYIKVKNKMMIISAFSNVALCWLLISHYGVTGAIISVIISELVIGLSYIIYCSRYVFKVSVFKSFNYNEKWEWRELK